MAEATRSRRGGRPAPLFPVLMRPRIELSQGIVIGPGKVELLQAIGRLGSISAAARELGMGYKRAWSLLDALGKGFAEPVIAARPGGAGGGGAALTPLGDAIVERYLRIESACRRAVANELAELRTAASPRAPDPPERIARRQR